MSTTFWPTPAFMQGTLAMRVTAINDAMLLAAIQTIVDATPEVEIVPSPLGFAIHKFATKTVTKVAMQSGIAR